MVETFTHILFFLGTRWRPILLGELEAGLQLRHRLAQEGVEAQGSQEFYRLPADTEREYFKFKFEL